MKALHVCLFDVVGLAHCRHLKTVRTHLSGLVYHTIITEDDIVGASTGLTADIWSQLSQHGVVSFTFNKSCTIFSFSFFFFFHLVVAIQRLF